MQVPATAEKQGREGFAVRQKGKIAELEAVAEDLSRYDVVRHASLYDYTYLFKALKSYIIETTRIVLSVFIKSGFVLVEETWLHCSK